MKWLAKNQIKLKSEILTPDIIIGLRSDTLHNTKQYFYFFVARYYRSCRIKEVLPKIEKFPSFLSFLVTSVSSLVDVVQVTLPCYQRFFSWLFLVFSASASKEK